MRIAVPGTYFIGKTILIEDFITRIKKIESYLL